MRFCLKNGGMICLMIPTQEVEVMGRKYSPSIAFYRLDPIAYQVGMNDYESVLRADHEEWGYYEELFKDEEE